MPLRAASGDCKPVTGCCHRQHWSQKSNLAATQPCPYNAGFTAVAGQKSCPVRKPDYSSLMAKNYLRSIRLLSECMQLFELASARTVRQFGLTHSQFDIIATLGNTPGMTCKELGEKTLITKGTLTGVLDRLEQKGWIQRERGNDDRRQLFIRLTAEGERLFDEVFPQVVATGARRFTDYADEDFDTLEQALIKLKQHLSDAV